MMNLAALLTLCILTQQMLCYNHHQAKMYLLAAALAYCPAENIPKGDCHLASKLTNKHGMKPVYTFSNGESVNPILYTILEIRSTKEIVISFSGTENQEQLLYEFINSYNVKYFLHPELEDASVVDYFYWYYLNEFRSDFEKTINKYTNIYHDYDFVFTGHSLGGAMTVHAAIDTILSGWVNPSRISVYTYGQPRVGNRHFTNVLSQGTKNVYRIVHDRDIVAHVPFCIPNFFTGGCYESGFLRAYLYHNPTEVWYNDEMKTFKVCDNKDGEDVECSNSITINSITDHYTYFGYPVGSLYFLDEIPTGMNLDYKLDQPYQT